MAKFTSTRDLNIKWQGHSFVGVAGTTHRLADALVEEFEAEVSSRIPGFAWVIQDELTTVITSQVGSGDDISMYFAPVDGQLMTLTAGTSTSPNTALGPLLKVQRTLAPTAASLAGFGDGVERLSAISGIGLGTSAIASQPVGVSGLARNASVDQSAQSAGQTPDAAGLYGVGKIEGTGNGVGMGAFLIGLTESTAGRTVGVEVVSKNIGTARSYTSSGYPGAVGIWLSAAGTRQSGCGIAFHRAFGADYDVGIGFLGGANSGVVSAAIRDDSSAATSIDIRGTHTGVGLDTANGTFSGGAIRIGNNVSVRAISSNGASSHNILYYSTGNGVTLGFDATDVTSVAPLRVSATDDLSLSSTTHGFQIGPSSGQNLAMDVNEIQSRNNGAASTMFLQADGGRLAMGTGSVVQQGSTAFPGSPAADDMFYRTDLDMWFFYDGTRWLSTTLYHATLPASTLDMGTAGIAASGSAQNRTHVPPPSGGSNIYIVDHIIDFFVNGGTALGASHKWVGTFDKVDTSNVATTIVTDNIDSGSSSVWRQTVDSVNALLGTTSFVLQSSWTKTGTPGNLLVYEGYTYRIVAT